jgi:hypothetical protein
MKWALRICYFYLWLSLSLLSATKSAPHKCNLLDHICRAIHRKQPLIAKSLVTNELAKLTNNDVAKSDQVFISVPKPSSLLTVNILMLLFYATLGSVMPYIPLFYRYLRVSGTVSI